MNLKPEARNELIAGLRAAADFIERLPGDMPLPYNPEMLVGAGHMAGPGGKAYPLDSKEGLALIASNLGGCDKNTTEWSYELRKEFGPVTIKWVAYRSSVCEMVKVGTKIVPAQPATEARIEDVYEYKCPSLLAALPRGTVVELPVEVPMLTAGQPALEGDAACDDDIPF